MTNKSTKSGSIHRKLTKAAVDSIPTPEPGARVRVWDTELRGFSIRIGSRVRKWEVQRDVDGEPRYHRIGYYPEISPSEAREMAKDWLRDHGRPGSPKPSKLTLRDAMQMHVERMTKKRRQPRSLETFQTEMVRFFDGDFKWLDRTLRNITEDECETMHTHISQTRGDYAGNHALRHFNAAYNAAARRHELPPNPARNVEQNPETRKQAPIRYEDLPGWFAAVMKLPAERRDFILFVAMTGLRRNDAASVKWSEFTRACRWLHRPNPKGGPDRRFDIPLSERCVRLLEWRRAAAIAEERDRRNDWNPVTQAVAPPSDRVFKIRGASAVKRRSKRTYVDKKGKTVNLPCDTFVNGKGETVELPSLHRLRDTFMTIGSVVGVDLISLKRLSGHSAKSLARDDVTAGYILTPDSVLAAGTQLITEKLFELIEAPAESERVERAA